MNTGRNPARNPVGNRSTLLCGEVRQMPQYRMSPSSLLMWKCGICRIRQKHSLMCWNFLP